jgi:hypothetical protein
MALDRTGITPIDDDGTRTTGTVFDAAWWDAVYDEIDDALATDIAATKLDDLAAPDDNTDLNVSTSAHGLTPKITGSDGDVLTKSGTAAVWAAPSGGGDASPFLQWDAVGNRPPASAYATPDTRNSHQVLDFDGSTDEEAVFSGVLPVGYASGGVTCELWVSFTSATSGTSRWQAAIERIQLSVQDLDADGFSAFQSAAGAAPATSGHVIKVSITFSDGSQMSSLAAGEAFRLKIRRDADGSSGTDDITTDAELVRVVLRETP